MSEFLRMAVILFAAVNPAGVALNAGDVPRGRVPRALLALAVAAGVLVVATIFADPLLDLLEIEPETFRIAAGIVMLVSAAIALWRAIVGRGEEAEPAPGAFAGWPLTANPAAVIATISLAADHNDGQALLAGLVAAAIAALALAAGFSRWQRLAGATSAFTAALLAVVAVSLIVEGVRDI